MKKLLFAIIIIHITLFTALCQNTQIVDSLETALKNYDSKKLALKILSPSIHDTTEVDILKRLSREYTKTKVVQALEYANKALILSKQIGQKKSIANSYYNLGDIFESQNNFSEALNNHLAALKIREEIGKKEDIANSYSRIGIIHKVQGSYSEALKNFQIALIIFEEISDKIGIANSYNNLGVIYNKQGNYSEALKNNIASLKIMEEIGNKKGIANSYNNCGNIYYNQGNYLEALKNYNASLKIKEEIGDKKGIGNSYLGIGTIYFSQSNFPEALKNYINALKIWEKLDYKNSIAGTYNNIGGVYNGLENYPEALNSFLTALTIFEEIGDKKGISITYLNIGDIYKTQGNYPEALKNYQSALTICEEIGDKNSIAISYGKKGDIYFSQSNYPEALKKFQAALAICEEIGYKNGISASYRAIGHVYIKIMKYKEATEYLQKGLLISKELGTLEDISTTYEYMAQLDSAQGNYLMAMKHYKLHIIYRDSIFNNENTKKLTQQEMQYDFDKKEAMREAAYKHSQDSIRMENKTRELNLQKEIQLKELTYEYEKKKALAKSDKEKQQLQFEEELKRNKINFEFKQKEISAKVEFEKQAAANKSKQEIKDAISLKELQKQKLLRNGFIIGFCLTFLLAGSIFFSLQQNKKKNRIISTQKLIVEEKNKEITDSITYALRIQTAILPSQKIVAQYLNSSFILYKPKDIVAGDFYWMETIDDLVLFAACDCTGHGVPGAMVSVVCHNALNRAVREFGLTKPSSILDKTTEIVLENFSKSEKKIQDGMDISICALNIKTKSLEWAGANNPLWMIKNGNLFETKSDKQCIGYNDQLKPFTNHQFKLESDTRIYLFTDGFSDQFGGERGKKLTKSRFRELLLSIQDVPMPKQATKLDEFITNYKQLSEQTDDILVIGVRV